MKTPSICLELRTAACFEKETLILPLTTEKRSKKNRNRKLRAGVAVLVFDRLWPERELFRKKNMRFTANKLK